MVEYLYKHRIWKITSNVIGINPVQEGLDKTDFETNYKSSVIEVTGLTILENTFLSEETYIGFKALVTGDITWEDVRCEEDERYYNLYLLTGAPL